MTATLHLTPTQHAALEALVSTGDIKSAAASLGITRSALEHRLRKVRERTGLTTVQLAWRLAHESTQEQETDR